MVGFTPAIYCKTVDNPGIRVGVFCCTAFLQVENLVKRIQQIYNVHMKAQSTDTQTSTTMTLRLSAETKANLAQLAQHTRRTSSFLANEAVTDYVQRELAIVQGIQRGLDDMEANRIVQHQGAMQHVREAIAGAQKDR